MAKHLDNNNNNKTNRQNICVNIISDKFSKTRAKSLLKYIANKIPNYKRFNKILFHDINKVNKQIEHLLPTLKKHFTYNSNSYYSRSLFFTSLAAHRYFADIDKLIFLDIDIQFNDNIEKLYGQFSEFSDDALIGIAYEQQPVYWHIMHEYRRKVHNKTDLGSPPPNGWPGFNSGVLLMNLQRMRVSKLFNDQLLSTKFVDNICQKYYFGGHLGDQDFYTVTSFDYRYLFHVLPCNWNRQLCQWWRYHGYRDIFDLYFKCDLKIKLFHGNCNSGLPSI
ncbi:xyloside xylosyltransferase 1-like [Oppia nitens]|uniref:xyloside xylosyltransferase 1-like n=1 Tax=Oppia nitens TaxID=1686743 RepID=UPI0023DBB6BE|nr:xyloside xylosyltransferase 1-like [Oppia nitens]